MLTPIHRGLGLPACDLNAEILAQSVEAQLSEVDDLDWKKSVHDTKNVQSQDELAKDISAMSNSGGGWIVFGVEEKNSRASALTPVAWSDSDEQRIRQVAYARIGPPVTGLEFYPVALDQGGFVVALRIPSSIDAPHLSRSGDDKFRAPFRNGSHTVYMSEREIEHAYALRFDQRQRWDAEIERVTREAMQQSGAGEILKAVMVAVPRERRPPTSPPVSEETARSILRRSFYERDSRVASRWSAIIEAPISRVGLRRWIFSSSSNSRINPRIALFWDGTVTMTVNLGLLNQHLQDELTHTLSTYVEIVVSDFFTLISHNCEALNLDSSYEIRLDLDWDPAEAAYFRSTSDFLDDHPEDVVNSTPIRVFTPVSATLLGGSSRAQAQEIAEQLALDTINQGGIRSLQLLTPMD